MEIVTIDKLGSSGDGLALLRGKPLYVPLALPQDKAEIEIISEFSDKYRGRLKTVLEASPDRTIPPCPYFGQCGGCNLQHMKEDIYRNFKHNLVQQAAKDCGESTFTIESTHYLHHATRRRISLKLQTDKQLKIGFYESGSRHVVDVENCLLLKPELQNVLTKIRSTVLQLSSHQNITEIMLTLVSTGVDCLLTLSQPPTQEENVALSSWAHDIGLIRIAYQTKIEPSLIASIKPVILDVSGHSVALPIGAFIQSTQEGQDVIIKFIASALQKEKKILDLFSGIGIYSLSLAEQRYMHAVEIAADMTKSLESSVKANGLYGKIAAETRDLNRRPFVPKELRQFDAVILNPPRTGALEQIKQLAKSEVRKIIMISCNPATFARDARQLLSNGYALKTIQGLDQFVWSPHMEILAVFSRNKH